MRILIFHSYPDEYMIRSIVQGGHELVVACPAGVNFESDLAETVLNVDYSAFKHVMQSIKAYHERNPIDMLLPVYEGTTYLSARVADELQLPFYSSAAAACSRNKLLSYLLWEQHGVPVPKTIPIVEHSSAAIIIKKELGYPCVLKLSDSMNSQGVIRVNSECELSDSLDYVMNLLSQSNSASIKLNRNRFAYGSSSVKIIAQEFCEGTETGVDVAMIAGRGVGLGCFEKAKTNNNYFAETMSVWPTSLGKDVEKIHTEVAIKALNAIGVESGLGHVEIVETANGPKVLEAGLRPGGAYTVRAIEKLSGINEYQLLTDIYSNQNCYVENHSKGASLYGGVIYQSSGVLTGVEGEDILDTMPGIVDYKILHKIDDKVYSLPNSAQPHYCYYLIEGDSREEVINRHQKIQETIRLDVSGV